MNLGAAADGIALVSLAGEFLASLAVTILCAGLAALGWFSRKKWYLLSCLVLLLANLAYLALAISFSGIGQLPMFALVLGTILAVGVAAIVGLGRCRPKIQFRLRTLLIAILVLSLPLSWFAVRQERVRRQRRVGEVRELGALVLLSDNEVSRQLGHAFKDVYAVFLTDYKFRLSMSGVVQPGGPPFPQGYPYREPTCICDGDLAVLKPLTTLAVLSINCRNVTDAGLNHLQGLARLRRLDLTGTQVTSEGIKKLQEALPKCEIAYDEAVADGNE